MSSRLRIAACLVLFALVGAACSSNTVVSREDRASESPAAEDETSAPAATDSAADEDADAGTSATDEPSSEDSADADPTTDERGDRDNDESDDTPQTPRELEEAEGFGLGGAEQLDGLVTDCQDGNNLACDVLFQISGFDSIEEDVALTCGGRSDVEVLFCTPGIVAESDLPSFDVTSEALGTIVERCEADADMTACDFLYFRSPVDSTFEEVGGTCGGRVNVAVPDCRTFLAEG